MIYYAGWLFLVVISLDREPGGIHLGAPGGAVFGPGAREVSAAWKRPPVAADSGSQPRKTQSAHDCPVPDSGDRLYRLRGRIYAGPLSPLNGYEHAILCLGRFPV